VGETRVNPNKLGRHLPYHDLLVAGGLNTQWNPETQAGLALLVAQNVDGYAQFLTLGKVPGSTRVSDSHGSAVVSLHGFQYFDLAGTLTRKAVSLAGGVLREINLSNGALTTLQSGLVSESLATVQTLDKLFLTSANQRSLQTGGIKFDGNRTTPWGVIAPGAAETVRQSFDSSAALTGSTQVTLADSTTSQDGGGSTQVNKTGTGSAEAYVQWGSAGAPLNLNVSAAGLGQGLVWLFLPAGALQKLKGSGTAVEIVAGDSALTNANHYTFQVGDLFPGWNLLSWTWSSPNSQDGSGATLTDVDAFRFRFETSAASTVLSGVLWDKFYTTSEGRPTVALGAAGNPTGTFTYRTTFLTENGLESNAGPASASISPSAQQVSLTNIPTSSDDQVIARRIYRDISGDGLYRFVAQIDDNITTSFTDNLANASLALVFPPLAGSAIDNSPPGRLYDVVLHENRVVGVDATNRFVLKFSDLGQPEAFRLVDEIQIEEDIMALESHALGTLIYGSDRTFLMTGDGVDAPIRIDEVNSQLGTNGRRVKSNARGLNFVVRENEVFLVGQPEDPWCINLPVLDQWRALAQADLQDMHIIHDRGRFRVMFFPKDSDTAFVYQYGSLGGQSVSGSESVDPQDFRNGAWFTLSFPTTYDAKCSEIIERTADKPELWIGANDGYVYWLQDTGASTWADGVGTQTVAPIVETHQFPIGDDLGGRGEPRFIEIHGITSPVTIDVTLYAAPGGTAIATIQYTATFTDTNPIVPVPRIGARGSWAKIRLSGFSGSVRRLRVYYIPRADFRGSRTQAA
jgi:hypothetical protein